MPMVVLVLLSRPTATSRLGLPSSSAVAVAVLHFSRMVPHLLQTRPRTPAVRREACIQIVRV